MCFRRRHLTNSEYVIHLLRNNKDCLTYPEGEPSAKNFKNEQSRINRLNCRKREIDKS